MKRMGAILAALFAALSLAASERKAVLLFLQFQDLRFSHGREQFDGLADSLGFYFNSQFLGQEFSFTAGPMLTIDEPHAKYGANGTSGADILMEQAVAEACRMAADSLSFADFINTTAPEIRDLLVLVPGKSEIDSLDTKMFRPQFVSVKGSYLISNRYRLACYGIASELGADGKFTGIGTLAHEYCHILGLSDLYDTDGEGSGGVSKALWGRLSIMDEGNLNGGGHCPPNLCAADYYTLGAGMGEKIDTAGTYTLEPIDIRGRYFIFEGSRRGEVFLAESREERGWDRHIGGHGMVLYHYDRSSGDALYSTWDGRNLTAAERWEKNRVNCNPAHQCVELQAPDTLSPFFPSGPIESFASETTPAFRYWDGSISPLAISGIRQDADGTVSFSLIRPIGAVTVMPFQNSVVIGWKCDPAVAGIDSCKVICSRGADTLSVSRGALLEENRWSCTIGRLSPASTYRVTVQIMKNGRPFFSASTSASTLPMRSGSIPFIYLKGAQRNADGSFVRVARIPLQVFNAARAEEVLWYFNGSRVDVGPDALFTIPSSGTLRAEIRWEDGSTDHILKEIELR